MPFLPVASDYEGGEGDRDRFRDFFRFCSCVWEEEELRSLANTAIKTKMAREAIPPRTGHHNA